MVTPVYKANNGWIPDMLITYNPLTGWMMYLRTSGREVNSLLVLNGLLLIILLKSHVKYKMFCYPNIKDYKKMAFNTNINTYDQFDLT